MCAKLTKDKNMKLGLDLSDVQPERESKTQYIVPGSYSAKVIDTEVSETKQKTGYVLKIYSEVTSGDNKGFVFVDNINIQNKNEDAERIGKARLRKYLDIFKLPSKIDDSEVLHGRVFTAILVDNPFKNDKGEEIKANAVKVINEIASDGKKEETKKPEEKAADAPVKKKNPWER